MDIETQNSLKLAVLAMLGTLVFSLVAYAIMAMQLPVFLDESISLADYQPFLKILIAANIIQFVMQPVLLTFFINEAGELENFTKTGLIENAWKVNAIGVLIIIIGAGIMGWAMASMFPGWDLMTITDPSVFYGNAIKMMNWSMFVQSLGFGIPVFYFLLSKYLAKDEIPFSKKENLSDLVGIVYAVVSCIPAVILAISALSSPIAGIFGIISTFVGILWCIVLFMALMQRDLPDVPED